MEQSPCLEAAIETGGTAAGLIKGNVKTVLGDTSEEECRWQTLLNYQCEKSVNRDLRRRTFLLWLRQAEEAGWGLRAINFSHSRG
jgi:hypothetical protein